ncbi:hypothetical protein MRB53_023336 [Persea americana]|uniref:Uncharacterized protein n=1 Tax=Persea americana TaxID=3435 RepID=A0ACC2LAC1_PERAE|nr:hypothetical protein MRB53_023336 [Persea americana]
MFTSPSKRVYISRHVVFDEIVFPFAKPANLYDVVQDAHVEISTFSDLQDWFTPSQLHKTQGEKSKACEVAKSSSQISHDTHHAQEELQGENVPPTCDNEPTRDDFLSNFLSNHDGQDVATNSTLVSSESKDVAHDDLLSNEPHDDEMGLNDELSNGETQVVSDDLISVIDETRDQDESPSATQNEERCMSHPHYIEANNELEVDEGGIKVSIKPHDDAILSDERSSPLPKKPCKMFHHLISLERERESFIVVRDKRPSNVVKDKEPFNVLKDKKPSNVVRDKEPSNVVKDKEPYDVSDYSRDDFPGSKFSLIFSLRKPPFLIHNRTQTQPFYDRLQHPSYVATLLPSFSDTRQ